MSDQLTAVRPFTLDPTGKSAEEIVAILTEAGFTVSSADITETWKASETAGGHAANGWPVTVVWLKNEEAPLLTVRIFNGSDVSLQAGQDLHLFARGPEWSAGADWSAVRTINVMR